MMFLDAAVKTMIVIFILRGAMTLQELNFNPLGKLVAKVTEPVLAVFKLPKHKADKLIPLVILGLVVILAVGRMVIQGMAPVTAAFFALDRVIRFLMIFYIVCIILGSTISHHGASAYTTFFYRIGSFWVKLARSMVNMPGNTVAVLASIVVFVVYLGVDTGVLIGANAIETGAIVALPTFLLSLKLGLLGLVGLLNYLYWLIIIRALMSWVSPDPSNPIVQAIVALTDPIMEPFRRIVPPVGMLDLSPIILIFLLYFLQQVLTNLIMGLL